MYVEISSNIAPFTKEGKNIPNSKKIFKERKEKIE